MANGGGYEALDDQDRLEIAAHAYLPTILQMQKSGKVDEKRHPWDMAVEVASKKFEQRFGRRAKPKPPPVAGPREATTAEKELLKQREAVDAVVVQGFFSDSVTIDRPKDPRKRAPARESATVLGKDIAQALTSPEFKSGFARGLGVMPRPIHGDVPILQGPRGLASMALTTSFLIPANLLGIISDEELQSASSRIAGQGGKKNADASGGEAATATSVP
jgi:hypothetical protein